MKRYIRSIGAVSVAVVVYLLTQIVVSLVLYAGRVRSEEDIFSKPLLLALAYIIAGICIIGSIVVLIKTRQTTRAELRISTSPQLYDVVHSIAGLLAYFMAASAVFFVVSIILPSLDLNQTQDLGFSDVSVWLLPLIYISIVIMPAIGEELLFRGYLFSKLKTHGVFTAAIIVSVLFGLAHGQVNVAIDTAVLSLVMVYLVHKRKSLWPAVFLHLFKNSIAFVLAFVVN